MIGMCLLFRWMCYGEVVSVPLGGWRGWGDKANWSGGEHWNCRLRGSLGLGTVNIYTQRHVWRERERERECLILLTKKNKDKDKKDDVRKEGWWCEVEQGPWGKRPIKKQCALQLGFGLFWFMFARDGYATSSFFQKLKLHVLGPEGWWSRTWDWMSGFVERGVYNLQCSF